MTEVSTDELKQAVESQHGCKATFVEKVPFHEQHGKATVWKGMVHVFRLIGHPEANRAFAWSYELPDGKRRILAVLCIPPITGPVEAVRAAIMAEARARP